MGVSEKVLLCARAVAMGMKTEAPGKCVCVCVCVCVHTLVHACVCVCLCACVSVRACARVSVRARVRVLGVAAASGGGPWGDRDSSEGGDGDGASGASGASRGGAVRGAEAETITTMDGCGADRPGQGLLLVGADQAILGSSHAARKAGAPLPERSILHDCRHWCPGSGVIQAWVVVFTQLLGAIQSAPPAPGPPRGRGPHPHAAGDRGPA